MAAFVVVASPGPSSVPRTGVRLNIFPGSATPAVFAADTPFWIGYGFVPEAGESGEENDTTIDAETGFELAVDGDPLSVQTDVKTDGARTLAKFALVDFPSGLPVGWHRFSGRWYDAGALVLSSDKTIEFVER